MYIFKTCAAICENFVRDLLTFIHSNWKRTIKTPDFFKIFPTFGQYFVKKLSVSWRQQLCEQLRPKATNNFWRSQKLVTLLVFCKKTKRSVIAAKKGCPEKPKSAQQPLLTVDSGPPGHYEKNRYFFLIYFQCLKKAKSIYSFLGFSSTWQITYTSSLLFPSRNPNDKFFFLQILQFLVFLFVCLLSWTHIY